MKVLSSLCSIATIGLAVSGPLGPAAVAQTAPPGVVIVDGKAVPYMQWVDGIWSDHLVARASATKGNPLLTEAFYRDALRVTPGSPALVAEMAQFYETNALKTMSRAAAAYGRILDPGNPVWDGILQAMGDLNSLRISGIDGGSFNAPLSREQETMYRQVQETAGAGQLMTSELLLRRLIDGSPGDLRFLMDLGIMYGQLSDWAMAAMVFAYSHIIYPDHIGIVFNLSTMLGNIGRNQEALDLLQAQIERNPKEVVLLKAAERFAVTTGKPDVALSLAKRWIAAAPKDVDAHNSLARILIDARRFEDADSRLEESLEIEPDRIETILLKTQTELRLGKIDEADERMRSVAARIQPDELRQILQIEPYNLLPDTAGMIASPATAEKKP